MVSVIIPTYKRTKDVVLRAVSSVQKQTYAEWEIYVIDDNHEDNPYSAPIEGALQRMDDKRIHYIRMDKNSGACAARNRGIQESKGEYVAFLDDDDEWRAERLEKQLPLLQDEKVGFSYCGMCNLYEKKQKSSSSWIRFKNGNIYQDLLKTNFMGGVSNVIVKRSAILACGGFREDMPAAQDYECWLRLAQKHDVTSLPEDLAIWHVHEEESITKILDKRIAGYRKILSVYHDDIVKNNKIYSYQLYNLGKFLILNKEDTEGIFLLKKSIKLHPQSGLYYIAVIAYWKIVRVFST